MTINKQELKYLFIATLFAFVVFNFIIPNLISRGIENSSPYLQFLIFNIGLFIFYQIFLKSVTLNKSINIKESLGIIFLFNVYDIWAPPLMVSMQGQLLSGPVLFGSAIDYILGNFAINTLGLSGFLVYLFTYVFAPFVILFIVSKLLRNFVRNI